MKKEVLKMANKTKLPNIVNTFTGEVTTLDVTATDPQEVADMLIKAKAFIEQLSVFEKELKSMAAKIMELNEYRPIPVGEYQWVHRAPITKKYSFITARQYIDEDLLVSRGAVSLSTTELKKIVAEQVKEGTVAPGTWDALEASAEVRESKPFVMLERIKRK
jgi:hypothetical protein